MKLKEIVVVSGKGGTGKTSITSSLALLNHGKVMICDTDVDAPDLWLLLSPKNQEEHPFMGMDIAEVYKDKCTGCGICIDFCRFGAIEELEEKIVQIKAEKCEGCSGCVLVCPTEAAHMVPKRQGSWFSSETEAGPLYYARLFPGGEHSGMLVSLLRKAARKKAQEMSLPTIIVDGPPGVACPAISSLTGASLAVAVTEPTKSGLHDLERLADLTKKLDIPLGVILNKSDLTDFEEIPLACERMGIPLIGTIPFKEEIPLALSKGKPPLKELSPHIESIWQEIEKLIKD